MSRVNMCIFFNSIHREREKKKRREYTQSAGIYPYWSRNTYREGEGIEREKTRRDRRKKKKKKTGLDLSVKTLTVVSCSNPPAGFPFKPTRFLSHFSCCCCCCCCCIALVSFHQRQQRSHPTTLPTPGRI
jgi:hypothetical protein